MNLYAFYTVGLEAHSRQLLKSVCMNCTYRNKRRPAVAKVTPLPSTSPKGKDSGTFRFYFFTFHYREALDVNHQGWMSVLHHAALQESSNGT